MIWHSSTSQEVLAELSTDAESGLSNGVADERLNIYGKNVISSIESPSFLKRFLEQLNNKIVYLLTIISIISYILSIIYEQKDVYSPLLIIAIVVINALVSAYHLYRCDGALEALRTATNPTATVIRDGIEKQIPAEELVPGDILVLREGDYISADARVIEENGLRCSQTVLSDDMIPVAKRADQTVEDITPAENRINMVFSGTSVALGSGKAVVVETGLYTEIGKNSAIIQQTGIEEPPIKETLNSTGKIVNIAVLVICIVAFLITFLQNLSSGNFAYTTVQAFLNAVALGVATMPESLPAISTIVIALGIQRIVRDNIIIKKISALEVLGKTGVICAHKTGILTKNHMKLECIFDGERTVKIESDEMPEKTAMVLRLATACGMLEADYTERAIEEACVKFNGVGRTDIENVYPRLTTIPFDSQRKTMTTVNMFNGHPIAIVKGAPEIVMQKCVGFNKDVIREANEYLADQSLRVLCIAIKRLEEIPANPDPDEIERDLTFVGLLGLNDPPRAEAIEGIALCDKAGIRTVMITGDNIMTAKAVARQIGIMKDGTEAITGDELNQMSDDELLKNISRYSVFARITPADKLRIIKAWQDSGEIVTVTGNSIEDADALNLADVGCAVGKQGTDVAKGSADIIITNNNFISIVNALRESRGFFENIKKSVVYLLSCNLGEIIAYLTGLFVFGFPPLAAVQLLWVNLLTDCLPTIALTMEPSENQVMSRSPITLNGKIFDLRTLVKMVIQSVVIAVVTLIAYSIGFTGGNTTAMTMAFLTLSLTQISHAYNIKTSRSIVFTDFRSNEFMGMSTILTLFISSFLSLTPAGALFGLARLGFGKYLVCLGLSLIIVPACEIIKFTEKRLDK